jgi:hypothetical protein
MSESTDGSFFEREGDSFVPTELARGPWGPDTLHGRVIAGLFAHDFEQRFGDPSFHFARLTIDLFRMPRVRPVELSTRVLREGRRIRVAESILSSAGGEIARASVVQLRKGEEPPGEPWRPAPWNVPVPDDVESMPPREGWTPMWETRPIGGSSFIGTGQKRMWIRETHAVVAGEPLTPFTRVAGASDIASPLANSGKDGLYYVNADITLYLHRLPRGEWIGWEVNDHQSADGVAFGECRIHDEQGAIGTSSVCAVANPRHAMAPRSGEKETSDASPAAG